MSSAVPALPQRHRFMVSFGVLGESSSSIRVFGSPGCTWADVVEEWLGITEPASATQREDYVLLLDGRTVGVDISLVSEVGDNVLCFTVKAAAMSPDHPAHHRIGLAYRAHLARLPWPAWEPNEVCPLNHTRLGLVADSSIDDEDNNSCHNLLGLRFGEQTYWVNRHMYASRMLYRQAEASNELVSRRPLPDGAWQALKRMRASWPILFAERHDCALALPVLVFERSLVRLDLSYSAVFIRA